MDYAHYRWSKEAQREIARMRRWRSVRRIIARLRDAIPWAFGKGSVMGQAYCPYCERDIDDCEIW